MRSYKPEEKNESDVKVICLPFLSVSNLLNVLSFSDKEAKSSAIIRSQLERKSAPIGPYDILIAGTALSNQAVLVTNNTKEFKRVPKLKIENWF